MDAARPVIQQRMNKYSSNEVGFCLLAVCEDKLIKLNAELDEYKSKGNDFMIRFKTCLIKHRFPVGNRDFFLSNLFFSPEVVLVIENESQSPSLMV